MLVNVLNRLDEPIILVLDDLHRIGETAVFVFLARMIDFAPPQLHLVLISRADPPLPINRLRAAGRLSEFRLHDLTFSLEETTAFFQINLDSTPPASLIETIHQRTEGWIVGVWLALLAMHGQADHAELARHIQNQTNRYTVDYLVDEVLSQQAPGVHEFLVSTAIINGAFRAAFVEQDYLRGFFLYALFEGTAPNYADQRWTFADQLTQSEIDQAEAALWRAENEIKDYEDFFALVDSPFRPQRPASAGSALTQPSENSEAESITPVMITY